MSTPPFLDPPACAAPTRLATRRGELAALLATPPDGASAAPVLLVPGITGSKEDFIAVLEPLAEAGHRVIAVDQRGQYESAGGDDPGEYDVAALAEDLLDVATATGTSVHLVGHSFGGLVARAAAIARPDAWRSLTLLDSGPAAVPHPASVNLSLLAQVLPVMDLAQIWVAKRQIESPNEPVPPEPETEEWMRRRFLANHPTSLLRIADQLLVEPDRVDALAAAALPLLVAYGEDDDAWPPAIQAGMADRLGARHEVIAGAGHSPAADRPDATAKVLTEFWASVDAADTR